MMADAVTLGLYQEERLAAKIHKKWVAVHDSECVRRRYRPKKLSRIRILKTDKCEDSDAPNENENVVFEQKTKTMNESAQTALDWVIISAEPETSKRSSFWSWLGF